MKTLYKLIVVLLFVVGTTKSFAQYPDAYIQDVYMWCGETKPTSACVWEGNEIVIVIEDETPNDRNRATMDSVIALFDRLFLGFEDVTGLTNVPIRAPWINSKPLIQIPKDNCGAGGLAYHNRTGISIGPAYFDTQYEQISNPVILQIFVYEMTRNFWLPSNLEKFDWIMDNESQSWGWWTNGMTGATPVIMADYLDVGLEIWGFDKEWFRNYNQKHYYKYISETQYNFDNTWKTAFIPWEVNNTGINDMMAGMILHFYDVYGLDFIRKFYLNMRNDKIENRPDRTSYDICRDNCYKVFSLSAETDLYDYFTDSLRWEISSEAHNFVDTELNVITNLTPDLHKNSFHIWCSDKQLHVLDLAGIPQSSGKIEIYTVTGKTVKEINLNNQSKSSYDLNMLQPGIYFFKLVTEKGYEQSSKFSLN